MARASTPTLLSLDRFAKILGIDPAHFNGVAGGTVMPVRSACSDVWFQHPWQHNDSVSREDLGFEIATVEREIADYLGYWPGPTYIYNEMHPYVRHHRVETWGNALNPNGFLKSIKLKYGKFILGGQRGATLVGTVTVGGGDLVYSDDDGDSVSETATITISTTVTDRRELKVFFADQSGAAEWEVREPRSIAISGGVATIKFWSWQLVDPDLWEALATDAGASAIEFDTANFVTSLEVYRIFPDFSQESCQVFWEPDVANVSPLDCPCCGGASCIACSLTVQDGCIYVRDVDLGIVVPSTSVYDEDEGTWLKQAPSVGREPDQIKVWYYAGDLANDYLAGTSIEPLALHYAQAIAWMTVARLERPFCSCGNLEALSRDLRVDLINSPASGGSNFPSDEVRNSPFGTRKGEVKAYMRLKHFTRRIARYAVV